MFDYKRILAWRRAHALALSIHESARDFSRKGHATLRSQLTRAASSAPTNIVEGCGAETKREFARYLDIAIKSLNETEYHLLAAKDHQLIASETWQRLTGETVAIRKMLYSYRKKVVEST